ncbi:Piso0_003538 [Millerozyma farinosa CBS 7064]|uniref:Piso0_003538 protein n=1 Tax=Pichia sorbitophila (strain ATCC MYA-4447 / BCRC 22081 / CBS 7064 / NBRC 10061 / NRRL Y-12695) TaxID=559304 RepID=G8YID5_PICSO|nr:Piso0_003538 [Millerozyma farinosa CBS 7064]CCE81187.1 Piso0_003538 [Millerozyma farinosa CBS 7064]
MLLSRSLALSILAAMGAQGLLIPSVNDVVDVFGKKIQNELANTEQPSNEAVAPAAGGQVSETSVDTSNLEVNLLPEELSLPVLNSESEKKIPFKYIIVFKDGVSPEQMQFHKEFVASTQLNSMSSLDEGHPFLMATKDANVAGGILDSFAIDVSYQGYIGYFTEQALEFIRRNPLVKFVEQDSYVHANAASVEKGAPWGLARISHRQPLTLSSFNQYLYDDESGKGVTAYVIDTGINVHHNEFGGRAKWGKTIPDNDEDADGNGHGTHCAGTIGSETYGVAKHANLVAVKVLRSNGSGSMSDVVKGVEYAVEAHKKEVSEKKKGFKGSAANMSLGGGKSPALDMAVNAAVKAGINFAVAAGNENQDACNTSPASASDVITVGASTISDERAYFSNWGKCVDIFGPGLNILSTYIGSNDATATLSGTSMASPHIAGLLAYYLSLQPSTDSEFSIAGSVSPEQLKKNLIHFGTKDVLTDIPEDTPNVLAFNGAGQNLTDFWTHTSSGSDVKSPSGALEADFDKLIEKTASHAKDFADDVKALVDDIYKLAN